MGKITTAPKILGIIGNPIEHSISPHIHNALIKHHNLNYVYLAFKVTEKDLKKAIDGMRALNIVGINVTIPHKEKVMKYLDRIDKKAAMIGAVNTILNEDNELIGYNTDIDGFSETLKEEKIDIKNKIVSIIGAGGAAKAIVVAVANMQPKEIFLLNRTFDRAKKLTNSLIRHKIKVIPLELTEENIEFVVERSKLLINATAVGMYPDTDTTVIKEFSSFNKELVVYDIVYTPRETKLLRIAKQKGIKTINGVNMLIYQAAAAFYIWTGKKPNIKLMKKVAEKVLK